MILLWTFLAVALQSLPLQALLPVGACLLSLALGACPRRLLSLLRRVRWILFTLLLIYGYVTPGEALWVQAGTYSPTRAGVAEGLLQSFRLLIALAALAVLLELLPYRQFIGGIYALAWPLRLLGLSRERIAVRLALTLHYADGAMRNTSSGWSASLSQMLQPARVAPQPLELELSSLRLGDGLLVLAGCALLALAVL